MPSHGIAPISRCRFCWSCYFRRFAHEWFMVVWSGVRALVHYATCRYLWAFLWFMGDVSRIACCVVVPSRGRDDKIFFLSAGLSTFDDCRISVWEPTPRRTAIWNQLLVIPNCHSYHFLFPLVRFFPVVLSPFWVPYYYLFCMYIILTKNIRIALRVIRNHDWIPSQFFLQEPSTSKNAEITFGWSEAKVVEVLEVVKDYDNKNVKLFSVWESHVLSPRITASGKQKSLTTKRLGEQKSWRGSFGFQQSNSRTTLFGT